MAAFFGILLLIVGIAYVNLSSSKKEQTSKIKKLEKENNEFIKYSNPVTIKNIKFNSSSDKKTYFTGLDNNLPKKQCYFISPVVTYYAPVETTLKIGVKFYEPSGLSTGNQSKNGYSYIEDAMYFPRGYNTITIKGWGYGNGPYWSRGSHSVQIWNQGKVLFEKKFKIR